MMHSNLKEMLLERGFTNKQAEVAILVTMGLSNKEIANQLFVKEGTIKMYLNATYKRLNLKSRSQLIVWCLPYMQVICT